MTITTDLQDQLAHAERWLADSRARGLADVHQAEQRVDELLAQLSALEDPDDDWSEAPIDPAVQAAIDAKVAGADHHPASEVDEIGDPVDPNAPLVLDDDEVPEQ